MADEPGSLADVGRLAINRHVRVAHVQRDPLGFIKGLVVVDQGRYQAFKCTSVGSGPDFPVMLAALELETTD